MPRDRARIKPPLLLKGIKGTRTATPRPVKKAGITRKPDITPKQIKRKKRTVRT